MFEVTTEQELTTTKDRVNRLVIKTTELASLSREDPSRQERALALMAELESSGSKLGVEFETIGEGEDRTIFFTKPVTSKSDQQMDASTGASPLLQRQPDAMGTFHTTREEYLFLDKHGVYKLVFTVDQEGELDPKFPFDDFEYSKRWAQWCREGVQREASAHSWALWRILSSGQFPNPPEIPKVPRRARTYDLRYAQREYVQREYEIRIGKLLDPRTGILDRSERIFALTTDGKFDSQLKLPGFSAAPAIVRVTKSDFIAQVMKSPNS